MPGNAHEHLNVTVSSIRNKIRQEFASTRFCGPITPADGRWQPEQDEERLLYETLQNRSWAEVGANLIDEMPDGFLLLTDQAFVAFLAAWLMRSMDDVCGENLTRESGDL